MRDMSSLIFPVYDLRSGDGQGQEPQRSDFSSKFKGCPVKEVI